MSNWHSCGSAMIQLPAFQPRYGPRSQPAPSVFISTATSFPCASGSMTWMTPTIHIDLPPRPSPCPTDTVAQLLDITVTKARIYHNLFSPNIAALYQAALIWRVVFKPKWCEFSFGENEQHLTGVLLTMQPISTGPDLRSSRVDRFSPAPLIECDDGECRSLRRPPINVLNRRLAKPLPLRCGVLLGNCTSFAWLGPKQ